MRKSNMLTFLSLFIVIGIVSIYMVIIDTPDSNQNNLAETTSAITVITTQQLTTIATPASPVTISMSDALFIGDSRTVGIQEYAGINEANYFCTVGLSLYNYQNTSVTTDKYKDATLLQLLKDKEYGKIYISMGVNDLGYDLDRTINLYGEFIELIKSKQPQAKIFVLANLHVAYDRSQRDEHFNNESINKFNAGTAQFCDNSTVFYLDANYLYDDSNGALSTDKTGDNTHLYAKYYAEWGEWIMSQTAAVIGVTN